MIPKAWSRWKNGSANSAYGEKANGKGGDNSRYGEKHNIKRSANPGVREANMKNSQKDFIHNFYKWWEVAQQELVALRCNFFKTLIELFGLRNTNFLAL